MTGGKPEAIDATVVRTFVTFDTIGAVAKSVFGVQP